jgi:hypothetical protein
MTCRHLTDPMTTQCCAAGVDYLRLTGGGVYSMMLRLPCYELEDRKGHEVVCVAGSAQHPDAVILSISPASIHQGAARRGLLKRS